MLNFILGAAGTGKTDEVTKRVLRNASCMEYSVIIMPEQTSFTYEKAFVLAVDPRFRGYQSVTNFSKLVRDIHKKTGGLSVRELTDGGSATMARRAVQTAGEESRIFRRAGRDADLCKKIAGVIKELREGGVSPADLRTAAEASDSKLSADKYRELSAIAENYEKAISSEWTDSAQMYFDAASRIEKSELFTDKHVFIDGFSWLSEPEFEIVKQIMRVCKDMTVVLLDDGNYDQKNRTAGTVFSSSRGMQRRLEELASEMGIKIADQTVLTEYTRFRSEGLKDAERWFAGSAPENMSSEGIYHFDAEDIYDEVEKAAAEISYLVREKGWRYKDFMLGVRDMKSYEHAVSRTFRRFDIPVFFDARKSLADSQLIGFARTAVQLCASFDTEKILTLAANPYSPLDEDEYEKVENYAFIWNLRGKAFREPFTRSPSGLSVMTEEDAEILSGIEDARRKLMEPLMRFVQSAKNAPADKAIEAVYALMKEYGIIDHIKSFSDEANEKELKLDSDESISETQRARLTEEINALRNEVRVSSSGLAILDSIHKIAGSDIMTADELDALINIEADAEDMGEIPNSLDEVTVADVSRMRASDPKAVFLMGLVTGSFPATAFEAPLLTFRERDTLNEMGGKLSTNFTSLVENEQLYLYAAVSAPSERLYLSYPKRSVDGSEMLLCSEVSQYISSVAYNDLSCSETVLPKVVNSKTAYAVLSEQLSKEEAPNAALAAGNDIDLEAAAAEPSFRLNDREITSAALGNRITLSPSKIDIYEQCPFRYFMQYMLKLDKRRRAEIDPMEAGSFVHAILERALRANGGDLDDVSEDDIPALAEKCAREYMEEAFDDPSMLDGKTRCILERLTEQATRLLLRLKEERAQCDFIPTEFEYNIRPGEETEPVELTSADGKSINVIGQIDRVDLYEKDGKKYIRVVDYKTGTKHFRLNDVVNGLNLQMLIYLFTVCRNGPDKYKGAIPAGVLYMPADPMPAKESDDEEASYRMDGLVLRDFEIANAMEHGLGKKFIPVAIDKSGEIKVDGHSATLEEMNMLSSKIDAIIIKMADDLEQGYIEADPVNASHDPCSYCDYRAVCRRDRITRQRELLEGGIAVG